MRPAPDAPIRLSDGPPALEESFPGMRRGPASLPVHEAVRDADHVVRIRLVDAKGAGSELYVRAEIHIDGEPCDPDKPTWLRVGPSSWGDVVDIGVHHRSVEVSR